MEQKETNHMNSNNKLLALSRQVFQWVVSNKQLTVIWITAILLCAVLLFTPKIYVVRSGGGATVFANKPQHLSERAYPAIQWNLVLQRSLIVLLIAGMLIYTFRNKNE